MHTIAIITCYMGNLPEWFQLWLNSCGYNETIDFFVYTDQDKTIYQIPDNVRWRNTSLSALQRKISNVCGFEVSLEKAYCEERYANIVNTLERVYESVENCWINLEKFREKYRRIVLKRNTEENKLIMNRLLVDRIEAYLSLYDE